MPVPFRVNLGIASSVNLSQNDMPGNRFDDDVRLVGERFDARIHLVVGERQLPLGGIGGAAVNQQPRCHTCRDEHHRTEHRNAHQG